MIRGTGHALMSQGSGRSVSGRELDARWGNAGTVAADVLSTRLAEARLSQLGVVLIDGLLHLLQDLVERGQVTTSFGVAHRRERIALHGIVAVVGTDTAGENRNGLIGGNLRGKGLGNDGQLQTLQFEQALTDLLVRGSVETASLDITQESVQSLDTTLANLHVTQGSLLGGWGGIVDVTVWLVSLGCLWLIVLIWSLRMAAIVARAGVDVVVVVGGA